VRQRRQFERHAQRGKFGFNEIAPPSRSLQAFTKAIGQALLKAYAFGRGAELVVTDVPGPQREDACLFCAQVVALAIGEPMQNTNQRIAAFLDAPIALLAADAGGHIDALIHHREIAIVVQNSLAGAVTGEY
jgi:hypothetical protein